MNNSQPICPVCGTEAELFDTADIYGGRSFGMGWRCPVHQDWRCGCHPNSERPLGTLANAATRVARMQAHQVFDPLWTRNGMSRTEAYRWLATVMGVEEQPHIGAMNLEQCRRVVELVRERVTKREEMNR